MPEFVRFLKVSASESFFCGALTHELAAKGRNLLGYERYKLVTILSVYSFYVFPYLLSEGI